MVILRALVYTYRDNRVKELERLDKGQCESDKDHDFGFRWRNDFSNISRRVARGMRAETERHTMAYTHTSGMAG